jgi:SAM-dependent methyltransferase
VDGVPVLLNEQSSLFSIDDFVSRRATYFRPESRLTRWIRRLIPDISRNITGERNYRRLGDLLLQQSSSPRVLVVGGSILGQGMTGLAGMKSLELVESDIALGPRTMLVSDAHDIPFQDGSFDAVIVQAVLEHVVDPYRCVDEIHRVLSDQGLVYAETPFMQQVHGFPYDFTRFTYLGHRRLFRRFEEVDSGAVCGPGMALAWSYQYFLLSFVESRAMRGLARAFGAATAFFLKYFDHYLIDKPGTLHAASGYYFLGRKGTQVLSDRDLVGRHKMTS